MTLLDLIVGLLIVGVVLYLVSLMPGIDARIKNIIYIVVIVVVLLVLIRSAGGPFLNSRLW